MNSHLQPSISLVIAAYCLLVTGASVLASPSALSSGNTAILQHKNPSNLISSSHELFDDATVTNPAVPLQRRYLQEEKLFNPYSDVQQQQGGGGDHSQRAQDSTEKDFENNDIKDSSGGGVYAAETYDAALNNKELSHNDNNNNSDVNSAANKSGESGGANVKDIVNTLKEKAVIGGSFENNIEMQQQQQQQPLEIPSINNNEQQIDHQTGKVEGDGYGNVNSELPDSRNNNDLQQGGETSVAMMQQPQQPPPLQQQPQQPPLQQQQTQQVEQGDRQQVVTSRREKMQQELENARNRNSPQQQIQQNPISEVAEAAQEEMPIPTIVKEEQEDEVVRQQQYQREHRIVADPLSAAGGSQSNIETSGLRGVVVNEEPPPQQQKQQQQQGVVVKEPTPQQQLQQQQQGVVGKEQPPPQQLQQQQQGDEEVIPPQEETESPLKKILDDLPPAQVVTPEVQEEEPPQQPSPKREQPPQQQLPEITPYDQIPDAVKNTMKEMEKYDDKHGKEKGYHYKKLMENKQREAELRRQQKNGNSSPADIVRPPPKAFIIDDPVKAQKFADFIDKKKKGIIRKEKLKHPLQTIVGGGNVNDKPPSGWPNGSIRKKEKMESPMNNYKSQMNRGQGISSATSNNKLQSKAKMPDLRPEAQPKKRVGEKVLRQIPIVKRAFKRSQSFETLNDAALSFARGLLMGVFKNNNLALDNKRKAALMDWLDLLSVSLPPEIGLHELVDTLKHNIDNIAQSPSNLKSIIDKHPIPDMNYSESCTKGVKTQGFFCGFWKLLHVASVGFAEQRGGLVLRELHPNIRVFSPMEAGSILREYMGMFFNCEKCSKRFIAQYDECLELGPSCHRLTINTVDATVEDWMEFPLWIWQIHNDISRSKAQRASDFHEKEDRRAEAKKWETYMGAVYPHLDQCIQCWTAEGTWDINAVYAHLEREYWTFGVEVDSKMDSLLDYKDVNAKSVSHGLGAYLGLGAIVLVTYLLKKYKIRATGRHKKEETNSSFPSGNGRIKYRDS